VSGEEEGGSRLEKGRRAKGFEREERSGGV
jgi:hypothetical protein